MAVFGNAYWREVLAPLLLLIQAPITITVIWVITTYYDGSVLQFFSQFDAVKLLHQWPLPNIQAVRIVLAFCTFEYLLLRFLPGAEFKGSPSPSHFQPVYKLNGMAAYFVTHVALYVAVYNFKLFSPEIVYDNLGPMITTLNVAAFAFCMYLTLRGRYFPEHPDDVRPHSLVYDFYMGLELYPTIAGVPLKQLVNCRFGMMGWSVLLCAYAAKQHAVNGHIASSMFASLVIQIVYIVKFFWWEGGYFRSIDIMHDRCGFMIIWGCMCWVTSVYTLVGFFLVTHPIEYSPVVTAAIIVAGLLSVWANYDADAQRQRTRETNGNTIVWGKKPKTILAQYKNSKGETHQNLLLVSGWWGVARHFQYVPELTLALMWTVPAGAYALPYFYFLFLLILLVDRSGRDEVKCRAKYGSYWRKYCEAVPYRMIPYIF